MMERKWYTVYFSVKGEEDSVDVFAETEELAARNFLAMCYGDLITVKEKTSPSGTKFGKNY